MGAGSSAPGRRPFDFRGKHAFITGGANGIGLSMAKLLLKRGAVVTITDVADAKAALAQLEAVIAESGLPGSVWFVKADVGNYDQVGSSHRAPSLGGGLGGSARLNCLVGLLQMKAAITAAEEQLGPIDCLVPNAGIASAGTGFPSQSITLSLCKSLQQDNNVCHQHARI